MPRTLPTAALAAFVVLTACTREAPRTAPATTAEGASPEASSCAMPPARPGPAGHASVTGGALAPCGRGGLVTGFHRDDYCRTSDEDTGVHVVCAEVTDAFLAFTGARGNDLVTPRGTFRGLRAGDRWCLCAARWAEAEEAGVAPPVVLDATDASAARLVPLAALEAHARR